jgi:hypothetical protein
MYILASYHRSLALIIPKQLQTQESAFHYQSHMSNRHSALLFAMTQPMGISEK